MIPPKEALMRRIIPFILALVLFASVRTSAQEQLAAQKWTDVGWYRLVSWQFTRAGLDTTMTIWFDICVPAIKEISPESKCFQHITGEWHLTCVYPMREGPAYYEWETAPNFARFVNSIIARHGEAAQEIFDAFSNAVARNTTTAIIEPTDGM
jgi:hypothetical protein